MIEITGGHLVAIVLAVVILAVAAVALTITAVFNSLNAHFEAVDAKGAALRATLDAAVTRLESRMDTHEQVMREQVQAIKAVVAEGKEEHKAWQAALDKTNERLDQLMMHLLEKKA